MKGGGWEARLPQQQCRGNAKSAGTHDAPIPGQAIRRVHKVPKKVIPERPVVKWVIPAPKKKKKAKKEKRSLSRKRSRSRSSSSSEADKKTSAEEKEERRLEVQEAFNAAFGENGAQKEIREQQEREELRRQIKIDEEETKRRKQQAAEWARQQAEREAKRADDARLAEEQKTKSAARDTARKFNLKGAFAVGGDDLEDEDTEERSKKVLAFELKEKKKKSLALAFPMEDEEASGSGSKSQASSSDAPKDAVAVRAALADPSAVRNFGAGEVAEKYKLLMEMKRKFRRPDFGGPAKDSSGNRPRSRSRGRNRRSPSNDRAKYNSVWIRPKDR